MTNQLILEKAINKAIDGGWQPYGKFEKEVLNVVSGEVFLQFVWMNGPGNFMSFERSLAGVLFDQSFAKALWGEDDDTYNAYKNREYPMGTGGPDEDEYEGVMWQYHLQQMVIAPNPIEYLGANI